MHKLLKHLTIPVYSKICLFNHVFVSDKPMCIYILNNKRTLEKLCACFCENLKRDKCNTCTYI